MNLENLKKLLKSKGLRIALVCVLALLLLLAVWRVFFGGTKSASSAYKHTELEERLSRLLEKIEGVKDATVMIGEEGGMPKSVVIIIKGDDGILTRIRVIDATANALNIARQDVLVYPAD